MSSVQCLNVWFRVLHKFSSVFGVLIFCIFSFDFTMTSSSLSINNCAYIKEHFKELLYTFSCNYHINDNLWNYWSHWAKQKYQDLLAQSKEQNASPIIPSCIKTRTYKLKRDRFFFFLTKVLWNWVPYKTEQKFLICNW